MSRCPTVVTLAVALSTWLTGAAHAAIGAMDNVPAATLLLPYFEVSPDANIERRLPSSLPEANNTVAQLHNASASPVLARVTVWTDYGIPTLGFDVYLNGKDSQDIDLRLLFAGALPVTGTGISRPNNVSGVNPPPFSGCAAQLNTARLDPVTLENLRTAHTGLPSAGFGNQCTGRNYGDGLARGYLTIDAVNQCSAATVHPTSVSYFIAGGLGVASNQNVLFGDYSLTDSSNNHAFGDRLVSIEADASHPITSQANRYTFYAGVVGYSARDNREPLATVWAPRFAHGGASNAQADLIVWRDPRGLVAPGCASVPAPWDRPVREIALFDEQSNAGRLDPTRTVLGLAAQRLSVNGVAALPGSGPYLNFYTPFNVGWTRLNLNDATEQPAAPTGWVARQAWVVSTQQFAGRFQNGQAASAQDSAAQPSINPITAGAPIYPQIPTTTTITNVTPSSSVFGQTVTFSFAVTPPAATGMVTVSVPTALCMSSLSAGSGSCAGSFPLVGQSFVTARFQGGATQYGPSTSASVPHVVSKADTSLVITAHAPDPSVVNTPISVTVSQSVVAPGSGSPAQLAGTITVGDGVDSCTIARPAVSACSLVLSTVGTRMLTATWPGNTLFNGSTSAAVAHTVVVARGAP